jgi:hypothetical protein
MPAFAPDTNREMRAPGAPAGSRGGSMLDLVYLVLVVTLFALSIAMIRFFDRL